MIHWRNVLVVLLLLVLSACNQLEVDELDSRDVNVNGSWKVVASPNTDDYNLLQSVAAVAANDV